MPDCRDLGVWIMEMNAHLAPVTVGETNFLIRNAHQKVDAITTMAAALGH